MPRRRSPIASIRITAGSVVPEFPGCSRTRDSCDQRSIVLSIPQLTAVVGQVEIAEPLSSNKCFLKQIALRISEFESYSVPRFPPDRLFRPGLEPPARQTLRLARPEHPISTWFALTPGIGIVLPIGPAAADSPISPATPSKPAPVSAPRLATPSRAESLSRAIHLPDIRRTNVATQLHLAAVGQRPLVIRDPS